MSTINHKKYHLRKRQFLSRQIELPDYVIAIVEDTGNIPDDCEDERWKWSQIELLVGNGYDQLTLNFPMETHEERADSLYKIRQLEKMISRFRAALEAEAKSMNARKSQKEIRKNQSEIIEFPLVA